MTIMMCLDGVDAKKKRKAGESKDPMQYVYIVLVVLAMVGGVAMWLTGSVFFSSFICNSFSNNITPSSSQYTI